MSLNLQKIETKNLPYTAMIYCKPGVGKSTAIGLIAERSEGNTLVLDMDRTITRTLAKKDVVKNTDKVLVLPIENRGKNDSAGIDGTFAAWSNILAEITPEFLKEHDIRTVAVDNISELERCILSDLGAQGKNKGVPAMADYQYMQFKLVNSLRYMKSWGVNIIWTAWETVDDFIHPDGTKYSRIVPKVSAKIVDNICGLCDVVGWVSVNKDGEHMILLQSASNIYAKNQVDSREFCKVEDFVQIQKKEDKKS